MLLNKYINKQPSVAALLLIITTISSCIAILLLLIVTMFIIIIFLKLRMDLLQEHSREGGLISMDHSKIA